MNEKILQVGNHLYTHRVAYAIGTAAATLAVLGAAEAYNAFKEALTPDAPVFDPNVVNG